MRTERDEARRAAVDAQIKVVERYYREVALRDEVEFTECEYRSILEERGQMVTQVQSQEQTIAHMGRKAEF